MQLWWKHWTGNCLPFMFTGRTWILHPDHSKVYFQLNQSVHQLAIEIQEKLEITTLELTLNNGWKISSKIWLNFFHQNRSTQNCKKLDYKLISSHYIMSDCIEFRTTQPVYRWFLSNFCCSTLKYNREMIQ